MPKQYRRIEAIHIGRPDFLREIVKHFNNGRLIKLFHSRTCIVIAVINRPKIRHIKKIVYQSNANYLSFQQNFRFELRPLRAKIFNDKVVRIIITKALDRLPSIRVTKLHCICDSLSVPFQALLACPPFYNLMKSVPKEYVEGKGILGAVHAFFAEFSPLEHFPKLNSRRRKNEDLPQVIPLSLSKDAEKITFSHNFMLNRSSGSNHTLNTEAS